MKPPSEKQAAPEVVDALAELLGVKEAAIRIKPQPPDNGFDYVISAPGHRFLIEYKVKASSGAMSAAAAQLSRCISKAPDGIPLIVVPFMGQVGRDVCEKAGLSWLDLCGNAKIAAEGLRIWIEGRPNKYSGPGRPPNIFAPKSSRIVRQLLLAPERLQTQSHLVRETQLGDGYVSRIVRRLLNDGLVVEEANGFRPSTPSLLLDAWHSAYDFDRHRIIKGHIAARSGDELANRLSKSLSREKLEYATTGLAAAWQFTHFTTYRIAAIYLRAMPPKSFLNSVEFSEEPKGANTWLVIPNDDGVFHGGRDVDGIQCVSPVQAYLDLKGQPERSSEAAQQLKEQYLNWGKSVG
jgi:Transcriptional regulator, AbiEi antitoxin, Type IV TA system